MVLPLDADVLQISVGVMFVHPRTEASKAAVGFCQPLRQMAISSRGEHRVLYIHIPWQGSALLPWRSLSPFLTDVVAAAFSSLLVSHGTWGHGSTHATSHPHNFLLPVSVRNPVCLPFPLHPTVLRALCCFSSSCCGQKFFVDPPRSCKRDHHSLQGVWEQGF